jgi:uncharacterized membrane protein YphA (DoxX/SURF4 family)
MLSAIFVANGVQSLINPDPLVPRAKRVTDRVAPLLDKAGSLGAVRRIAGEQGPDGQAQLPTDARTLVRINGAVQAVAGLMLATGRGSRGAAAALAGTLVPTTLAGHAFWEHDDPAQRRTQQIQLLKNIGLFGGLLLAAVDTEGRPSLRYRTGRFVGDRRRSIQRGVRAARRDARIAVKSAAMGRHLPG